MFTISSNYKKIAKLLNLDKPLIVFDIETTGLAISSDKIIQIAYIKIWPDGREKKEEEMLDPEIIIPREASMIHGIKNSDVRGKPKFRDRTQLLWDTFSDCYYGGFNIMEFDLPILRREFIRCGMDFEYKETQIIDSRRIFHRMVPRTLAAAYKYYCSKETKHNHTALKDAEISAEILLKQLEEYSEVRDWSFVNKIHSTTEPDFVDNGRKFYWQHGEAHFAFSKHKDKSLNQVKEENPEFLKWLLGADFSDETKNIVRQALKGRLIIKKKKQEKKLSK